jgi:hypothetical protein
VQFNYRTMIDQSTGREPREEEPAWQTPE